MNEVMNTSGVRPRGRAVLVKPYELEVKEGLLVIPKSAREHEASLEMRAVVVEVGPYAWHDEPAPRAVVGERVLIAKFSGAAIRDDVSADKQTYRVINDRDIIAVLES